MDLAINCLNEKKLYKFRSIDRKKPCRTKRIFTHNELYFASPLQLNDPWETQPQFTIADLDNLEYRKQFVEYHLRVMFENKPSDNEDEVRDWLQNLPKETITELTSEQEKIVHLGWMKSSRIYSLSATVKHPLLWSHYSDSHTGYCLVFDASTDIFGSALKVNYSIDYPRIDILNRDEEELLKVCVLTKAKFWGYEEEYRLVSMEPSIPAVLQIKNNIYNYPDELLIGVIFGCRMSQKERDWILKLIKKSHKQIQIKEVKKNPYHYSLDIVDI